jgi:hypothetical protein
MVWGLWLAIFADNIEPALAISWLTMGGSIEAAFEFPGKNYFSMHSDERHEAGRTA